MGSWPGSSRLSRTCLLCAVKYEIAGTSPATTRHCAGKAGAYPLHPARLRGRDEAPSCQLVETPLSPQAGERGGHHYIGTTPLRPTLMRAALKVPSGFLVAAATLMAAPGLSSPLSPT